MPVRDGQTGSRHQRQPASSPIALRARRRGSQNGIRTEVHYRDGQDTDHCRHDAQREGCGTEKCDRKGLEIDEQRLASVVGSEEQRATDPLKHLAGIEAVVGFVEEQSGGKHVELPEAKGRRQQHHPCQYPHGPYLTQFC